METANSFKGRKVLVTGGTGMIGRALVELLLERGAHVRIASLDDPAGLPENVEFMRADLTLLDACLKACEGMEDVFHLAGIKGGVGIGRSQGAKFLEGNSLVNLHMLKSAWQCKAERYLFTSTIGVYPDGEIFKENDVWDKPPHPSDWYGAWAKRFGELQCEAYREQYNFNPVIVRPANIYGPFDNFNPKTAMVIPALIARACAGENPLVVWGDGSPIRDFIYSKDCARGMILSIEAPKVKGPVNLGSGVGVSIREVAETICKHAPGSPEIKWDTTKPLGNKIRRMDMTRAKEWLGFVPQYSFEEGIKKTLQWYLKNKEHQSHRYSIFKD